MDDPKELALSIRVMEEKLNDKKRLLEEIRKNCNHVWKKHKGIGEKGETLFESEICEICDVVK